MTKLVSDFKEILTQSVSTCWQSPSNIALIKYWGKKGFQLPANPSLSFSLSEAYTITRIKATYNSAGDGPEVSFFFEGERNPAFASKIEEFLYSLEKYLVYLPYVNLSIESGNNFPHSAGIASSASSMSALAMGLVCIEQQLLADKLNSDDMLQKASFIARLGSGSACRSVYGGYSIWGKSEDFNGSSDEYAVPVDFVPGEKFRSIRDSILIVNQAPKKISSRIGHQMMNGHPFAEARYIQAVSNLKRIKQGMIENDWNTFTEVVENEALTLHAMMMSSTPGFILMHPNTLNIVEHFNEIRKQNKIEMCFTLDAGPNIHILYPEEETEKVKSALIELKKYCDEGKILDDMIGKGPENKHCR
jgi:diphosphomevalonate decarboxylase